MKKLAFSVLLKCLFFLNSSSNYKKKLLLIKRNKLSKKYDIFHKYSHILTDPTPKSRHQNTCTNGGSFVGCFFNLDMFCEFFLTLCNF